MAPIDFDFQEKSTGVFCLEDLVFKVKFHFNFSPHFLTKENQNELDQVIRGVIVMENFQPIRTPHFIVFINTTPWQEVNKFVFLKNNNQLRVHTHMYMLDVFAKSLIKKNNDQMVTMGSKENRKRKMNSPAYKNNFTNEPIGSLQQRALSKPTVTYSPSCHSQRSRDKTQEHHSNIPSIPIRVLEHGKWSFVNGQWQTKRKDVFLGIATPRKSKEPKMSWDKSLNEYGRGRSPSSDVAKILPTPRIGKDAEILSPRVQCIYISSPAIQTPVWKEPTKKGSASKFSHVDKSLKSPKQLGNSIFDWNDEMCINSSVEKSSGQHRRYKSVSFKAQKRNGNPKGGHVQLDRHLVEENESQEERKLHDMVQSANSGNDLVKAASWVIQMWNYITLPVKRFYHSVSS